MLVTIKILVSRLAVAPVSGLLVVRLLRLLEVCREAHSHRLYVMNLERQSDVIAPRGVRNSKSGWVEKTRDRDYVTRNTRADKRQSPGLRPMSGGNVQLITFSIRGN